ncbi:MAG: NFACT RNA binding domain-containing protein, partial [Gemmatimonadota bacterium]
ETRHSTFSDALARLERDGPSEELWRLVGGRPGAKGKKRRASRGAAQEERLPYTRLKSSGGLEIRVGRGPRDNDALTFRHSAPDDIWLHASQASGAHVVLRWGRRDENPPQRDLLEAAVAAAVHSGSRHSGAVAVSWTRRKYVRKPRKSPPGTVSPDRVQTLVVEPDEDLVRSLREAASDLS